MLIQMQLIFCFKNQKQVCGRNEQANIPRNIEAIKNYAVANKIYIRRTGPTCSMSGGASAPEQIGLTQPT